MDIEREILELLRQYTDNGAYWYPLCILKRPISVVAYDLDKLYKDQAIRQLENVLHSCSIKTAYSLQLRSEHSEPVEKDMIALLYEKDRYGYNFPWYAEAYYFDHTRKWMLYVSHEGTITFTGREIVRAARELIPEQYLYK